MKAFSAAFLDRDGTVVRDPGYPSDPESVALLPGAAEAIAALNARGIPVVIVTNQSGIGRGLYAESDFRAVQRAVERRLAEAGARLDAVYHCPHDPERERCGCRKPATGLFRRAARELGLDLGRSLYVGDRARDVLPGLRLGGRAYLVRGGEDGPPPPGCGIVDDLREAVRRALAEPEAVAGEEER